MENHQPTLNFYESGTNRHIEVHFGYMSGVPSVAIFLADDKTQKPIIIEKNILETMINEGWEDCDDH